MHARGIPAVPVTIGHPSDSDPTLTIAVDAARLRLDACVLEQFAGARSRVTARFVGAAGESPRIVVSATQEGTSCPGGDLRLAALATFEALTRATQGVATFDLIGVKPVRAFDATVLMVAALVRIEGEATRVIGAAVDEGDAVIATARAALHGVNRLVAPRIAISASTA
ncbi:MAG: hypothetical protein IBJ03_11830 [Gemmatimonadaceae bacterium]|nr:hypothetical protein [Gemmatimonadaceae bacterium]